jgi:hypothetical protein
MSFAQLSADEVAHALAEAKARGLPDGWDVKLDVRNLVLILSSSLLS